MIDRDPGDEAIEEDTYVPVLSDADLFDELFSRTDRLAAQLGRLALALVRTQTAWEHRNRSRWTRIKDRLRNA